SAKDMAFALGAASQGGTAKQGVISAEGLTRLGKWAGLALVVLLAVVASVWLGPRLRPAALPSYRRITFERGTVYSAPFTADGMSLVYSASWNGKPLQLYTTPVDALQARPLELGSAHLLGISRSNELGLELSGIHGAELEFVNGTLARAPLV